MFYKTNLHFNNPVEDDIWEKKMWKKRRKMLVPSIFLLFSEFFTTLCKTVINFGTPFSLLSAELFQFGQVQNFEVNSFPNDKFFTVPN